jgi:hypothetical protein
LFRYKIFYRFLKKIWLSDLGHLPARHYASLFIHFKYLSA